MVTTGSHCYRDGPPPSSASAHTLKVVPLRAIRSDQARNNNVSGTALAPITATTYDSLRSVVGRLEVAQQLVEGQSKGAQVGVRIPPCVR